MTHNNNKKLQLSFLLKIKNKNVVSFLLVLQILFFFFEYFWKRNMMSRKFEESTHDTLFDGQKLNC